MDTHPTEANSTESDQTDTQTTSTTEQPPTPSTTRSPAMCQHEPPCPAASAIDRDAARVIATFCEQGWSLLCNGVILFEDTGELLPDGSTIAPHRGPAPHNLIAA
jgi:uncharacterized protein DUF5999